MVHRYVLALAVALLTSIGAIAQTPELSPSVDPTISVEGILNADGTINRERLRTGSVNISGWRMELGAQGEPRFLRDEPAAAAFEPEVPGDEAWDDRFGPPGINGPVYAVAVVDGDLYVGGSFSIAGNTLALNLARWNGTKWSAVGNGTGGTVYSLAAVGHDLYVGGQFLSAGDASSKCIVQYDTEADTWIDMKGGVYGGFVIRSNTPLARVHAIAIRGDEVFVGGTFYEADGVNPVTAVNIARWSRATRSWSSVPGLFPGGQPTLPPIYAMLVDGSDLYVGGGMYNRLHRWNGTAWSAVGGGLNDTVYALLMDGRSLIVGGAFTQAGTVSARRVARYDLDAGTWSALGSGFDGPVFALAQSDGILYAGGRFVNAGFSRAAAVARWNGSSWSGIRNGISDTGVAQVRALLARTEGLYAAGRFRIAGSTSAHSIALWTGAVWRPVVVGADRIAADRNGVDGPVHAMAGRGNELYVGGDFGEAGGDSARRIARWDGREWKAMGSGIEGASALVRAVAVDSTGNVYVGGIFTRAGGVAATGIARWDGSRWHALGTGVGGAAPYVFAITVAGGSVYVGGAFTTAGGSTASLVARWDPSSSTWSALGDGLASEGGQYAYVTSLASMGGELIAGGSFVRSGTQVLENIARWNGSGWVRLAARDLNAPVTALLTLGDTLVVAGEFTRAGTDSARYVAAFTTGRGWQALGTGLSAPATSLAFNGETGELVVGGSFATAGGAGVRNVARWANGAWSALGRGTNAPVLALCMVGGFLHAGGEFTVADAQKTNFVSRWDGGGWSALGSDASAGIIGTVLALAVDGDDVYIGGIFEAAGGVRTSGVARWDGNQWSPLGSGVDGPVRDIAILGDTVYVGGEFRHAGPYATAGIARWIRSKSHWEAIGGGMGGPNPYVFAIAVVSGDLFVGGSFMDAGGVPGTQRIARWSTRSNRWSSLAGGISGTGYYTYVSALAVDSVGRVFAGGVFPRIGSLRLNNTAMFDGTWHALSEGTNHGVYDVAVAPNGDVFFAGEFLRAGNSDIRRLARWDGTRFAAVGRQGFNSSVHAVAVYAGVVYAGGVFTVADGFEMHGISRLINGRWTNLGSGVTNPFAFSGVFALDVNDSALVVGGNFTLAGRKPSYYFGRWVPALVAAATRSMELPDHVRLLLGAAPNPSTGAGQVRIILPSARHVVVELFAIDGRRVATLAEGVYEAGPHALEIPTELVTGTYMCRLVSGAIVEVEAMEVVR